MYINTNEETTNEIKKIFESQSDKPENVRIFIAGIGWGGPSLGLGLDEKKAEDVYEEINGVTFVMAKDIYDQMGEITVEYKSNGYSVIPTDQEPADCSSCSSC